MQGENCRTRSIPDCTCRMLVEAMGEGALVLTIEGIITYCNQTFARLLELPASQVQGNAIYNYIADPDCERFRQHLDQSRLNTQIEISLISRGSLEIPTLFSVFSCGDLEEEGQPSVYAVVKDLSDLRKVENSLEVRTRQLEESTKDLENFASAISHDLRTPLRHIKNFSELLSEHLQGGLDNQSGHDLDVISAAATDMNLLLDKLLDWARIGSSPLQFNRVDLNLLVNNVVKSFEREVADRRFDWDIENLPVVSGDLNMLQTAFSCLVSNALKFTRLQPAARIRIAPEPSLANKNTIVVSIKDNGVGFCMQHVDKMFGLFQKMHNQKEFEGDGIGLATVKRIVQRHGGRVWAKGELNQGAVFYIALPKFAEQ